MRYHTDVSAGLDFVPGFIIRATDFSAEYAAQGGKAAVALAEANRGRVVPIASFAVGQGDSFAGSLLALVSLPAEANSRGTFDLAFASHMLYQASAEAEVETLINDVISNLLSDSGIFLLYHAAATPGTLVYLRAKFGRRSASLDDSDTPAVNVGDPVQSVRSCCAKQRMDLNTTQ